MGSSENHNEIKGNINIPMKDQRQYKNNYNGLIKQTYLDTQRQQHRPLYFMAHSFIKLSLQHSDEGLTLETSIFELLRCLIYLIDLVVDNLV